MALSIQTVDARGRFTKSVIAVYKEIIKPKKFLRSYFKVKETSTLEVSIEVERGKEKIAVDVKRGTNGNLNSFSLSSEKIFIPPYYDEKFNATEIRLYDRLANSASIDSGVFTELLNLTAEKMGVLQDKIDRRIELQCAQVMQTGIVTIDAGVNIDYKRKAASVVVNAPGAFWTVGAVDPAAQLETAANFLRQVGKSGDAEYDVICGTSAYNALVNNTTITTRGDLRRIALVDIKSPRMNSEGAAFHGRIDSGAYIFNIWTYPEVFDNASDVSTPYIDANKIVVLPKTPRFTLAFAAVPKTISDPPARGAFHFSDWIDNERSAHWFKVKAAALAVPVAIDQVYSAQVVA